MKCPSCQYNETKVVDSRLNGEGTSIRRRRECLKCEKRFTTYEYVEHVPLMIVKRDGRRQPYDRKKIISGIVKACEKRPVSIDKIEAITDEIGRIIQKKYDREVIAKDVGEMIMEQLAVLDEVAYVRFASVYRQFRDVNQFMSELKLILDKEKYKMIQVELSKIIIDEKRQDQIIVLKEKDGDRQFPIVIGFLEASSIKMKLSNIEPPRPMTHDLLVSVAEGLGGVLEQVVIDQMVNNTFHAKLEFKLKGGKKKVIDSRPSDGIALAVRTNAAIFVDEDVLKKAAIFNA